jgi:2-polyprenyl-6-methoxyphenol hydroxylase-like FAD-dependent oxidoreductase
MRIACVGGGPAGLTAAIFAASSGYEVTVHERRPALPEGFGVALWRDFISGFRTLDAPLADALVERAVPWRGQRVEITGHAPIDLAADEYAIARPALTEVLEQRATTLGVRIEHGSTIDSADVLAKSDVVIAADGLHSTIRAPHEEHYGTRITHAGTKYAWLSMDRQLPGFLWPFHRFRGGWHWGQVYPYAPGRSTFIVETTRAAWTAEGYADRSLEDTIDSLEQGFAQQLDGARLTPLPGADEENFWQDFEIVTNRRWTHGRTVLVGDAAHTTHFSIGFGSRLAMEDAVALVQLLDETRDVPVALERYSARRIAELSPSQDAASRSLDFLEHLDRYIDRSPADFARLLERRRSRVLRRLPPSLFLPLSRAKDRIR